MAKAGKKRSLGKSVLAGALVGLACGVLAWALGYLRLVRMTELMTLDLLFRTRKDIVQMPQVGYVNMDNESCDLAGPWPWPRNHHVGLVETLGFYGARAAGYDVFFIEPSNVGLRPPEEAAGARDPAEVMERCFRDYDAEFERALAKSGVIYLGQFLIGPNQIGLGNATPAEIADYIATDKGTWSPLKKESMEEALKRSLPPVDAVYRTVEQRVGLCPPLPRLIRASQGLGFEQILADEITGTVYEYPMFFSYDGRLYPALGLVIAADLLGVDLAAMTGEAGEHIELRASTAFGGVEPGTFRIPVNDKMRMFMNWSGRYFDTFFHVSYKQLSHYYAWNEAKRLLRAAPPPAGGEKEAVEAVAGRLRRDHLVPPEEAGSVAATAVLAWLAETGRQEQDGVVLARLAPLGKPEECRRVLQAVRLAHAVRAAATPEALAFVRDHAGDAGALQIPGFQPSATAYPDLPPAHQAEIARNVLFFQDRRQLDQVAPLWFPPCLTTRVAGREADLSPTMLSGKVLMIGLEGEGTIDLNPQPYEKACAMVALHANAINTFLSRQFLSWPSRTETVAWTLAFAVLVGLATYLLPLPWAAGLALLAVTGHAVHAYLRFSLAGRHVEVVGPALAAVLAFVVSMGIQLYLAYREKQKVKGMFGKMVSPNVLKVMSENPDLFSLSGRRQACTSFFSSMDGFNDISKGVTSQEMIRFLSHYLTPASQIITSYEGYIDKYESHIIMADYGVPVPEPNHTQNCLYACLEQQLDIMAFRTFAYARFGRIIGVSMGVNTGYVSAGNMGSDRKMQYTIMGDTVNTAARFRPANWIYNYLGSIIIGETTYPLVGKWVETRQLDKLLLKGKTKPTAIYQVMGWVPDAYLELRRDVDPRETLRTCWAGCPPEKIYGYARIWKWRAGHVKTPLAEEIAGFFAGKVTAAARFLELDMRGEIQWTVRAFAEAAEAYAALSGAKAPGIPSGTWEQRMEGWAAALAEMESALHRRREDPAAQKLLLNLGEVTAKVESFQGRLKMKTDVDPRLEKSWDLLRDHLGGDFAADGTDYAQQYAAERAGYDAEARALAEKVAARKQEYHETMARAGARTPAQVQACQAYEEGLHLHWERRWDEAIARFKTGLELMPGDGAATSLVERVEGYKTKPPKDSWQGEFVQTKK